MADNKNKKGRLNMAYFRKAIEYVGSGTVEYFTESTPVIKSTLTEARYTARNAKSAISSMGESTSSYIKSLKGSLGFRGISRWFLEQESEDDDSFDGMELDDGTVLSSDLSEISSSSIHADEKFAKKISKSVIESSHQVVDAQIASTANIVSSIDKQTSVISAGFDSTNSMLKNILEVLTKNTAAIIETTDTTARLLTKNESKSDPNEDIVLDKFNLSKYKEMVKKNLSESQGGMAAQMAMAFLDPNLLKDMLGPKELTSMLVGKVLDKSAPNLKKTAKALDDAVNDVIMSSLIRLGESNNSSFAGVLKAFGINSTRKTADTSRSELSIKSVPFDTVTKEAITNAIPGYLRKILVAVGGNDEVYDYRSRSFRSSKAIKREFADVTTRTNELMNSTDRVRSKFNSSNNFTNLAFDVMMDNLSSMTGDNGSTFVGKHKLQQTLSDFSDVNKTYEYLKKLFPFKLDQNKDKELRRFAQQLSSLDGYGIADLKFQAAKKSVERNMRSSEYLSKMDQYQMDTSMLKDGKYMDRANIFMKYGKAVGYDMPAGIGSSSSKVYSGENYTNLALYEIYRRLNKGINVFQVGQSSKPRVIPFEDWKEKYLKRPDGYKPKNITEKVQTSANRSVIHGTQQSSDYENPLHNNQNNDGTQENLTRGQRFSRWGKTRGGEFLRAMSSGDPDEIRAVISDSFRDISQVAGDEAKKGLNKINESFGNVSGFIKSKLFGTEYSYKDDDGNTVHVKNTPGKNGEKGGLLGFLKDEIKTSWNKTTAASKKWMQDIQKDFDYGDSDEDKGIKSKRKKLIGASIGAFAGAGILGGPMGLIVGSLAGSALSTSGIGKKLKDKLFGVDPKTGKATGILSKAFDKVTRPIEYQVKKTIAFFSQGLKKHIFGPLSDIGYAIKNRVKKSVNNALHKYFLDPLKNAGKKLGKKLIGGLFNAAGKLWEVTTGVKAGTARAKAGAAMGIFDIGVSGLAKKIIGDNPEGLEELNRRAKARGKSAWQAAKDVGSMKDFNEAKDAERADRLQRLQEYMKESSEKTASNTAEIKDVIVNKVIPAIKGQDIGDSDNIIPFDPSRKKNKNQSSTERSEIHNNDSNNDNFKGSALSSVVTLATSGDTIDNRESSLLGKVVSQASKKNSTNEDVAKEMNSMIALQRANSKKDTEKKDSLWTKLLGGLKGIGGTLLALLKGSAILWLVGKDLQNENGLFRRTMKGLQNFLHKDKDPSAKVMNLATSIVDSRVDNTMDWVNPLADIDHTALDGAGNGIKNQAMTRARDQVLWRGNLMSKIRGDSTRGLKIGDTTKYTGNFSENFAHMRSRVSTGASKLSSGMSKVNQWRADHSIRLGKKAKFSAKAERWKNRSEAFTEGAEYQKSVANSGQSGAQHSANMVGQMAAVAGTSKVAGIGVKGLSYGLSRLTGHNAEEASEFSDKAGGIAETGTSGLMTANMMSSAVTGKKSWASIIVDVIKKSLSKLGGFLQKKFPKIGTKIVGVCDDIFNAVKTKIAGPIVDKMKAKIAAVTGKMGLAALSAGTLTVIGAVAGLASGFCGTEHLFGVLPGEADAKMKAISSAMGAAFGALETIPVAGYFVAILDILDAIVAAIPAFKGKGIKQHIATMLYNLLSGKKKEAQLKKKQEEFSAEKDYYNQKFGTQLDDGTFNDMVNSGGFFSRIWSGKAKKDKDGHLQYDEQGQIIKSGGIKNFFTGHQELATDSSGNIIRSEDGKAVAKIDKYGNKIKTNNKLGDLIVKGVKNRARTMFGGNVYKTDAEGNVLYDENGKPIVDHRERSMLGKALHLQNPFRNEQEKEWINKLLPWKKDKKKEENEDNKEIEGKVSKFVGKSVNLSKEITKHGGLVPYIASLGSNKIKEKLIGSIKGTEERDSEQYELDENGKPIEYLTDDDGKPLSPDGSKFVRKGNLNLLMQSGLQRVVSKIISPLDELRKGADEYNDKDSPWRKDGNKGPITWLKGKIGSLWDKIAAGISSLGSVDATPPKNIKDESSKKSSDKAAGGIETSDGSGKVAEGGNPLNKDFKITSKFGPRTYPHSGTHKGVDLVPADGSKDAIVGSRYEGTVVSVKSNVDDTDTAKKVGGKWTYKGSNGGGNIVSIQTKDGKIITNMHLKARSIPSNITPGATVHVGDKLGVMGSTGWSTGPHLHYQIEEGKGNAVDPTSTLSTGRTISEFRSTTNQTQEAKTTSTTTPVQGSNINTSSDASTSDSSSSVSGSGPLGSLLEALKSAGSNFLSKITGGLIGGSSSDGSSSSSSTSDSSSGSTHGGGGASRSGTTVPSSPSSNVEPEQNFSLSTNPDTQWIAIVRQVKEAVAAQKPEYNQGGSMEIQVGNKKLKIRPDCTGIISGMLKIYGALPESGNVHSSALLQDGAIPDKFDRSKWPGWDNLLEGDIMARNGHAEIFAFNKDGKHYVYNGGSTKALAAPGATASSKSNYDVIWRSREQASSVAQSPIENTTRSSVTLKDGSAISSNAMASNGSSEENNAAIVASPKHEELFNQLKARGYSDYAASGIMGAWEEESHNNANTLEGDYFLHPDIKDVTSTPIKFSEYAEKRLFPGLAKSNISINKDAYKGEDGKYYPGLGLAQWTGPRSKKLLDIARSKGKSWTDHSVQMDYFDSEMEGKSEIYDTLNRKDSPSSAAEYFTRQFEGCNKDSWISKRKAHAEDIYKKYGSKGDDIPTDGDIAAGGPEDSEIVGGSSIGTSNYINRNNSNIQTHPTQSVINGSNLISFKKAKQDIIENKSNVNTSEIIQSLYQVIRLLEGIYTNSGQSNSYLSSLSKLQPAVGGSTTQSHTLPSSQVSHKPAQRYSSSTPNGNRMISSMIRPS